MDKELIITMINGYYSDSSMKNMSILIAWYCKDRGKKEEDIFNLLRVLSSLPVYDMVQDAISWYAKELNLTIINKIENNQLIPFKIL